MDLILAEAPVLEPFVLLPETKATNWYSFSRVDDVLEMWNLVEQGDRSGGEQLNHGSQLDLSLSVDLGTSNEVVKPKALKKNSADGDATPSRVAAAYSSMTLGRRKKRKNPTQVHGDAEFGTQELKITGKDSAHPLLVKTPRHDTAGRDRIASSRSSHSLNDLGMLSDLELNPKMAKAIKQFNGGKPKNALAYLKEESLLKDNPKVVASLLHNCELLDRAQIGEYLSSGEDEEVTEVLQEFIAQLDFDNVDFDIALRRFLYCFLLPGEAQKIDRLVRQFATQYYVTHPEDVPIIFKNELSVYVLSFGSIMLNSDAHNSNVVYKMTEKQFIENIQYTTGGEDIPAEFLKDLYFRINTEEIKMEKEEVRMPDAVRKGWLQLHTKGSLGSGWKQRWVVLSGNCLYIFRRPEAIYGIKLENVVLTPVGKEKGRRFCVRLHLPSANAIDDTRIQGLSRDTKTNHILMGAASPSEISKWCKAIEANTLQPERAGYAGM